MDLTVPRFLARPTEPVDAGVVVIHEGMGITAQVLRFAERLAAEGYVVAVPDLFFRSGGPEAAGFQELIGAMTLDQTIGDLSATSAALRDEGARRIGITGFCMGGRVAYQGALHGDFDAAVGFYGGGIAAELGSPRCPTLLLFGGDDPYIPSDDIERVVAHHPETVVYSEAGHGFMRDGSDSHHRASADDGWRRLLDHFDRHLHPPL